VEFKEGRELKDPGKEDFVKKKLDPKLWTSWIFIGTNLHLTFT
jgi:hypothetical protein